MLHAFQGLKKTRWGTHPGPSGLPRNRRSRRLCGWRCHHRPRDHRGIHGTREKGGPLNRSIPSGAKIFTRVAKPKEVKLSPLRSDIPDYLRVERETPPDMVKPVEPVLTAEEAIEEAKRCLQCGGCSECMECVKACEAKAINHALRDEHARDRGRFDHPLPGIR